MSHEETSKDMRKALSQAKSAIERKKGSSIKIRENQVRIGLWGPRYAGKTVYLLALYLAAQKKGGWLIGFDDVPMAKRQRFIQLATGLSRGVWPDATETNVDEPNLYSYLFFPPDNQKLQSPQADPLKVFLDFLSTEPGNPKQKAGISIQFADVAGERYFSEDLQESKLWKHLAGCHGIICLLDPDEVLEPKGDDTEPLIMTSNLVENLYSKVKQEHPELIEEDRYLPHHISVCFTKTDQEQWRSYLEDGSADKLADYLGEQTGMYLSQQLNLHFRPEKITYYCISSIGWAHNFSSSEPRKQSKIDPLNVFNPLEDWFEKKK